MGAISMHQLTPFLGIYFSFIIHFMSLNIVILALKLAKVWHIDPILGHYLYLSKNRLTMETRNLKYDMTRTFPPSIGLYYMLRFLKCLHRIQKNNILQKNALCDLT